MRVLVIGAGMYVTGRGTGRPGTVLASLAQVSRELGIEEVVVASPSGANAEHVEGTRADLGARLGIELPVRHADSAAILESPALLGAFDCAIVVVPDDLHHRIGTAVLAAGLHCLMVKPLAPTVAEANDLVELQTRHDLLGVVEFHKRFDEANLLVKQLLARGELGRLSYIMVDYSQRIEVPARHFKAWSARTNIFQYLGVHYVDLIHFMTGLVPRRAMAIGARGVLDRMGIDTWDAVLAHVEWVDPRGESNVVPSQFAIGWIDPGRSSAMSDQKYCIVAERGRVDCDQKNRGVEVVTRTGGVDDVNPYFAQFLSDGARGQRFTGYGFQSIRQFLVDVWNIKAGRESAPSLEGLRPTFREALASTAVIEAVNRSLVNGSEWIDIHAPHR